MSLKGGASKAAGLVRDEPVRLVIRVYTRPTRTYTYTRAFEHTRANARERLSQSSLSRAKRS